MQYETWEYGTKYTKVYSENKRIINFLKKQKDVKVGARYFKKNLQKPFAYDFIMLNRVFRSLEKHLSYIDSEAK